MKLRLTPSHIICAPVNCGQYSLARSPLTIPRKLQTQPEKNNEIFRPLWDSLIIRSATENRQQETIRAQVKFLVVRERRCSTLGQRLFYARFAPCQPAANSILRQSKPRCLGAPIAMCR